MSKTKQAQPSFPPNAGLTAGRSRFFATQNRRLWAKALWIALCGMAGQDCFADEPGQVFVKLCAPCHSKDGKARTPAARKLGVKDLSISKLTEEEIIQQIREGKQPQEKDSKMPAFKEKLTTEEIKSLVAVVKKFRGEAKSP